jgi:hypothetical protein
VYRTSLFAVVCCGLVAGCRPAGPPGVSPIKPFAVQTNDGIDHELYRGVSLDAFLKQLPSGSIDSLDMSFDNGSQVFALVKVPEQPARNLTKVRFETTFKTQDGQKIEKRWTAAAGRTAGKVTGLFCLPPSVTGGETRVVRHDG